MAKGRYFSGIFSIRETSSADLGALDTKTLIEIAALDGTTYEDANGELEISEASSGSYREGQGSNIVVSKTSASTLSVVGFTPAEYKTFKDSFEKVDVDLFIYNTCGGIGYGSGICIRNKNISINQMHTINGVSKFDIVWDKIYDAECSEEELELFDMAIPA